MPKSTESGFTGFMPETFAFLMDIALNNNKEYFENRRSDYKKYVYEPMAAFERAVAPAVLNIDPRVRVGRYAISRINRDTRYSADKSPYRDHMWLAYRSNEVRLSEFFVMYFEISPVGYGYGIGMYGPLPTFMEDFRKRALANPARLSDITRADSLKKFTLSGEDYARPKVKDAPEELLPIINKRYFSYTFRSAELKNTMSEALVDEYKRALADLAPMYRFANDL